MASIEYSTIIDISLPLNGSTIAYPGNPTITINTVESTSGTSYHSHLTMSSHSGTHIDAPRHVFEQGKTIDALPLAAFIGPCRVIDATKETETVSLAFIQAQQIQPNERILLKTENSEHGFYEWRDDYIFLSSEAASYLANQGIQLIGIDALSIKQRGSQDHIPHTAFLQKNIPILEGINLQSVEAGEYLLITQPLAFTDIDGSPVRALLLQ
jgi:arylformamidase